MGFHNETNGSNYFICFALFLVLTATSVCVTQADTMSQQDAITTAKQAIARSGGNPDLQNFNTVIDKGNYFKIKITLKLMTVSVLIKFIKRPS